MKHWRDDIKKTYCWLGTRYFKLIKCTCYYSFVCWMLLMYCFAIFFSIFCSVFCRIWSFMCCFIFVYSLSVSYYHWHKWANYSRCWWLQMHSHFFFCCFSSSIHHSPFVVISGIIWVCCSSPAVLLFIFLLVILYIS